MEIPELLSWLSYTDLSTQPEHQVLQLLHSVLEAYPEEREVCRVSDELLADLEELLGEDQPDLTPLSQWPTRYGDLLKPRETSLEAVEKQIEALAENLEPEQFATVRLTRLERILNQAEEEWTPELESELQEVEAQVRQAWSDYSKTEVKPDEVSAESVGGHRFLEEGFQNWFEAFELTRRGEFDEAWEAANEGNRLMMAVSIWSDSLRVQPFANLGEA